MTTDQIGERVLLQITPNVQMTGDPRCLSTFEWFTDTHTVKGVTFESLNCQIPFVSTGRRVLVLFSGTNLTSCQVRRIRWWKLYCKVPEQYNQIRSIQIERLVKSLEKIGFEVAYYKS